MAKSRKPEQPDKSSPSAGSSPLTSAVTATMPIVYSAQIAHMQASGPLPHPDVLRQYEDVSPGLVERIVKMAEDEAEHRRNIEMQIIDVQSRDQKAYRKSELLGQVFGLLIGLSAITGAVVCAVNHAQIAAAFIGTSGVTGLVTAFIMGRTLLMKQKEQEFRQQQSASAERAAELKRSQSEDAKKLVKSAG